MTFLMRLIARRCTAAAAALFVSAGTVRAGAVLVELFTSQGCSSCPPAERVLSEWGREAFHRGEVVPLAFHVDYWDGLGWRDRFASPDHTNRQRLYASSLGMGRIYTPQAVVHGRADVVGSDLPKIMRAVEKASSAPGLFLGVRPQRRGDDWTATVSAEGRPSGGEPHLFVAYFENGIRTAIGGGENKGRQILQDFVVRELRDLGPLRGFGPWEREDRWKPPSDSDETNMGVAVFVQDAVTMAVDGARAVWPMARPPAQR